MWAALLPSSYYAFYVAALAVAVRLAVFLSLLVSADRVLSVAKFGAIKLRAWATGRTPKEDWFSAPLPEDPEAHPKVRAAAGAATSAAVADRKGRSAEIVAQESACMLQEPPGLPLPSAAVQQLFCLGGSTRTWPRLRQRPPLPLAPDNAPPAQVAVQLPMFNERAVCQAIIDCCAELDWPAQRLKIQVGAGREAAAADSCTPPSTARAAGRRVPSTQLGRLNPTLPPLLLVCRCWTTPPML